MWHSNTASEHNSKTKSLDLELIPALGILSSNYKYEILLDLEPTPGRNMYTESTKKPGGLHCHWVGNIPRGYTMKVILITLTALFLFPLSLLAAGKQVVDIDIEGMSCKFCAYSVQKSLSKLPGVEMAEVNIDNQKAHIVMSAGNQADVEQLKKKISDSGFTPVKVVISTNE